MTTAISQNRFDSIYNNIFSKGSEPTPQESRAAGSEYLAALFRDSIHSPVSQEYLVSSLVEHFIANPDQATAMGLKLDSKSISEKLVQPWLSQKDSLPPERRELVLTAFKDMGRPHPDSGKPDSIDCSHWLHQTYSDAGLAYGYLTTAGIRNASDQFQEISADEVQAGDLILWDGHVGMVWDPSEQLFMGSQSSTGVAVASYAADQYWGKRGPEFYRAAVLSR